MVVDLRRMANSPEGLVHIGGSNPSFTKREKSRQTMMGLPFIRHMYH